MEGAHVKLRWTISGMLAVGAASQALAHHGGEPPIVADHVASIIEAVNEACFVRGSDAKAMADWAEYQHWTPARERELGVDLHLVTPIAGWTYETPFAPFAIIQSRLNAPYQGSVCSITTKIASVQQHAEVRAAFQKQFRVVALSEPEREESHTDKFWIERDRGPPIKATILHAPTTQTITIRIIFRET